MNIVHDENTMHQDDRMSYANPRRYRGRPVNASATTAVRHRGGPDQSQQMRLIGLALCIVSAVVTLLSAALIAIRF